MNPIKPFDRKPKPTAATPSCGCPRAKPAAPQATPLAFSAEAPSAKMFIVNPQF